MDNNLQPLVDEIANHNREMQENLAEIRITLQRIRNLIQGDRQRVHNELVCPVWTKTLKWINTNAFQCTTLTCNLNVFEVSSKFSLTSVVQFFY